MTPQSGGRPLSKQARKRGQALLEFALVMPILLLLMMGIFDFGRAFLSYAMASNALRNALRNAEVFGYNDGAQINYTDCKLMREAIKKVFFVGDPQIKIMYQHASGGAPVECTGDSYNPALLNNGDLLEIEVVNKIQLLTPFITQIVPNLQFNFWGERTIVKDIPLTSRESGDVDYDGLLDDWEVANFCPELPVPYDPNDSAQVAARTACLAAHTGTDDPDNDGCNNGCEETNGTYPTNDPPPPGGIDASDSDGDGLKDGEEIYTYHTDPLNPDTDGDGISDGDEVHGTPSVYLPGLSYITDPLNPDTDGDGLADGDEVGGITISVNGTDQTYYSSPLLVDTDGDTISDYDELYGVGTPHTNPGSGDTDNDGLTDIEELLTYHTDPTVGDTDKDGILDGSEVHGVTVGGKTYITDPLDDDTDDDGLLDGEEETFYLTSPLKADSDHDGLTDGEEATGQDSGGKLICPGYANPSPTVRDSDGDGLTDYEECVTYGTDPWSPDTDGDGLSDGYEALVSHTSPLSTDSDGDGISDYDEVYGSGSVVDTDNDGLIDDWEVSNFCPDLPTPYDPSDPVQVADRTACLNLVTPTADPDNDGVQNFEEQLRGLDPLNADTDGDTLTDGDEIYYRTDPLQADSDSDGLRDDAEFAAGTNPWDSDSDDDGLSDGQEVNGVTDTVSGVTYKTNPLSADSDGDGLTDGSELLIYHTNPNSNDTDGDKLLDNNEALLYHTDPNKVDTDGDTLNDYAELLTYHTDPLKKDTDGDGLFDGDEVNATALNGNYRTDPNLTDTDGDGLKDNVEINGIATTDAITGLAVTYYTDPTKATGYDTDGDGLSDGSEINTWHTNPTKGAGYDSDGDGLNDGLEVNTWHTDPAKVDTDGDGLSDGAEVNTYHTLPLKADTDGDGVSDGVEVNGNADGLTSDPLNVPTLSIVSSVSVVRPATNVGCSSAPGAAYPCPVFTVTLQYPTYVGSITVHYFTQDGTATSSDHPTNRNDFEAQSGTLTFTPTADPASLTQTITIVVSDGTANGNKANTANETFTVKIDSPTPAQPQTAISNDTSVATFNP